MPRRLIEGLGVDRDRACAHPPIAQVGDVAAVGDDVAARVPWADAVARPVLGPETASRGILQVDGGPDLPRVDGALGCDAVVVEAVGMAHHQRHAVRLRRRYHPVGVLEGRGYWLLHQDVLAVLGDSDRDVAVGPLRRADVHRVHVVAGEHFKEVGRALLRADLGSSLGRPVRHEVRDGHHLPALLRNPPGPVSPGDPSGPDHRNVYHVLPPRPSVISCGAAALRPTPGPPGTAASDRRCGHPRRGGG